MKKFLLLVCFTILGMFLLNICAAPTSSSVSAAVISGTGSVSTDNYANRTLQYYYSFPSNLKYKTAPFLVMVPGLGGNGKDVVTPEMMDLSQNLGFVIIAPTFKEDSDNYETRTSYQYPAAWSGKALNSILNDFVSKQNVYSGGLYMYGFSAGAQFVERYSLLYPNYVTACVIHAAGSVTLPTSFQKTKFFISVGTQDENFRKETANDFYTQAKKLGIRVQYKQYNYGHMIPAEQMDDSAEFFKNVRYSKI